MAIPDAGLSQVKFVQMTNGPLNCLETSKCLEKVAKRVHKLHWNDFPVPKWQSLDQQFVGMDAVDGVHNLSRSQHGTALELVLTLRNDTKITSSQKRK